MTGIIPGTAPESGEWAEYCPSSEPVSVEKIRRAKGGTGFFHDLFKGRKSLDITEISEPIDREVKEVQCLPWPKDEKWSTASMTLAGDTRAPQARVEASIEDACVNLGFQYYAIRGGRQHETATYGNSLGLSAAASEVGSKTGTAAAVGGQLGNNRVRNERYWEAEAVCLSDEYAAFLVTSPPVKAEKKPLADEKPVTSTPLADTRSEERTINVNVTCKSEPALATTTPAVPPPAKIAEPPCSKCSNETITKFNELLKKHSDEIDGCDRWSFYNMTKRLERAHDYIELYACTRDVKYLRLAENDYQIAESNHQLGWDISKHQVEADKLMADGYMTWAGVTYVLHGQNALNDFVVRKRIEDGRKVPTEFNP
ncbi:MAG: hypothetical protein Q7T51_04405 [Candidatus Moranbacteria bacterium]|nr:hypothetical protein [Candidatus Moranbacteria bacterium]